jgi:ribosomal protein S12 methylthiotransferase accessory factor YcaO
VSAVDEITIQTMARAIAKSGCNPDDERAVMRALLAAGTNQGDVMAFADESAKRAKNFKQGER